MEESQESFMRNMEESKSMLHSKIKEEKNTRLLHLPNTQLTVEMVCLWEEPKEQGLELTKRLDSQSSMKVSQRLECRFDSIMEKELQ